jgi:hypothetical protein
VLLVHHQPSGIDVDNAFGALPFEDEALDRAQVIEVSGLRVPLPTPEDLIVMKAVAHRSRDQADIAAILDAHGKLNLRRVRQWVRAFAEALETPELLDNLETLLRRRRPRRKGKGAETDQPLPRGVRNRFPVPAGLGAAAPSRPRGSPPNREPLSVAPLRKTVNQPP